MPKQTIINDKSDISDIKLELLQEKRMLLKKKRELINATYQHLDFMIYTWIKSKDDPLIIGYHTYKICKVIDDAIRRFQDGESVFIRIKVHQRAGKSDIVSRYLPPHFAGLFPELETMSVSYSAGKATAFSRFGRRIMESQKFRELFPDIVISKEKRAANEWELCAPNEHGFIEPTGGKVYASGLTSGLTGNGYHLGLLDDYCGSRADAESPAVRDNMWEAFTDDFMTRRAPHSITIILATQWHEDDIHGRIERKNNPLDEDYDPKFPKFEVVSFPATVAESDYKDDEEWQAWKLNSNGEIKKYLFEERYSHEWYESMYSTLGVYAGSAMMDCDPIPREGGVLKTGSITYHDDKKEFPMQHLKFVRVWDYAHTKKDISKRRHDPDYTGGTLLAYRIINYNSALDLPICELWVLDYRQTRETAVKRDKFVLNTMIEDGPMVEHVLETSLDSLDGFYYLRERVKGVKELISCNIGKVSKLARSELISPIFDAGNVHVLRGEWNKIWLKGIERFDGSGKTHDEMIDNMTCGFEHQVKRGSRGRLKVKIG